jgi:transcriptional regulator with XRE-family HTH domain
MERSTHGADKQRDPDNVVQKVGHILRKRRKDMRWTLGELATATEVSVVTLGKIERGEMNPTIGILWKIAHGLNIPLTDLLDLADDVDLSIVREEYARDEPGVWAFETVFRLEQGYIEIFRARLRGKSEYRSDLLHPGIEVIVTVLTGQLTMLVEDKSYSLHSGDAIRFKSSNRHVYKNDGNEATCLQLIVRYR